MPVFICLLHHPVVNRKGELVTTSVTNMDIHDLSRSARTYGVEKYFIVTPLVDQLELVERILSHWRSARSQEKHPDRFEALSRVRLAKSFEEVKQEIIATYGVAPEVVLTDATLHSRSESYASYRSELEDPKRGGRPVILVFGTGWGVAQNFYPEVHRILAPVYGPEDNGGYNHLSVRSAVGIILDRLFGH
ncbi:RNA methyltransferase [Bdellovibrionota bacterium FG-2]